MVSFLPAEITSFEELFNGLIDFIKDFALALSGVAIVIGGWLMMTASGKPEKFEQGKKAIIYAFVAIILVLMAEKVIEIIIGLF